MTTTRVEAYGLNRPHTVYVVSTPDATEVLYVGMTREIGERLYFHERVQFSRWFFEPHVIDLWSAPNRAAARVLERDLIRALLPRDNKAHRTRPVEAA